MSPEPTIVLVHGALTDASVWRSVSARLQTTGRPVVAPALPMRTSDVSIPTRTLRWMAERAGSSVVEVDSSHAVPLSNPGIVTETIERAAA